MAVRVVGVSFDPVTLERLDGLAAAAGVSRSAMVGRLVEAEVERARGRVRRVVVVDGVRYVPARGRVAA